jgi:hypothetical protein
LAVAAFSSAADFAGGRTFMVRECRFGLDTPAPAEQLHQI